MTTSPKQRLTHILHVIWCPLIEASPTFHLACVASVSVGFRSKELPREKRGGKGGGKGRKETLADKHLDFGPILRGQNPVPWSFFAPESHGNACYAGYISS